MHNVRSSDGTTVAFDQWGEGSPLIYVGGALNDRSSGAALAAILGRSFTVLSYDRRGRGASGDTQPYTVEREVEDLEALIAAAGGSAFVYGMSSGGVLAMEAAARGLAITRLAVYEPPLPATRLGSAGRGSTRPSSPSRCRRVAAATRSSCS
jgi:pimeloyl-ACP methyl ester carboxylesterase